MSPTLLSLPYDVRYLIYQQLFPPDEQIYIQAYDKTVHTISPPGTISANILLANRQFGKEAGGFIYNGYLFNLVGTKQDCLANYKPFLRTLRKYARSEVNINAFSNGDHSATMCLSLQAGDAKMGILNRRRRGEPKTIRELQDEQDLTTRPRQDGDWIVKVFTNTFAHLALVAIFAAPFASAIVIPRAPAITITQILANTVMSTQTVPYSSVASGTNPINGLPAAPPSSRHSTSSKVSFSIITVPTQQSSATLTPVPYGTYTPSGWKNTTSSTVHPSSSTATTESHTRTPLPPVPTTSRSESTSSWHSKPTTSVTVSPSSSHTSSTTTSTSRDSGDGMIGAEPTHKLTSTTENSSKPSTNSGNVEGMIGAKPSSKATSTTESSSKPTTTLQGNGEGFIGAKPSH
ncbi:hypothetical protein LTR56_026782 [Elasticomyces elasticus]|nr:hypothetical protein LTR56_026782 [Elasticomyces elasticus]KAK3617314.1 hypothetical protein LTR22_026777 [Elasticomyces elasticus]